MLIASLSFSVLEPIYALFGHKVRFCWYYNYWGLTIIRNGSILHFRKTILLKVTVQFETEGRGQNEIFSHVDRLEVKL